MVRRVFPGWAGSELQLWQRAVCAAVEAAIQPGRIGLAATAAQAVGASRFEGS